MHPWNLNPDEARMLQESLAEDCIHEGEPEVRLIAALDISVYPDSRIGIASALLYDIENKEVEDEVVLIDDLTFPYISGLLAFREAPLMLKAVMKLDQEPDFLLVDGHGYAHPRRFGLASHLGLHLEIPSIGCAKTNLVGEFDEPPTERGEFTDIWEGEPLGYCYRSMEGAKPIFLSPGHKIDRRYIPEVLSELCDGRQRLPKPLHMAHNLALEERRRIETLSSVFSEDVAVFFVGGALRDLLLGVRPDDYDLLTTNFDEDIQQEMEDTFNGRIITLDEERSIYRLVGGDLPIDITEISRDGVVDDLHRRDFTANSIALDLDSENWIDPTGGREDIENQELRATEEERITEDPLRIIRAYRISQGYDFRMVDELTNYCRKHADKLENVSRERIVEELFKISSGLTPGRWYERMQKDEVVRNVPFFRLEGPDEIKQLGIWKTDLMDRVGDWLGKECHGEFTLFDGMMSARMISKKQLDEWPFHRHIKQITRASYQGLDGEHEPDVNKLRAHYHVLLGRILGRGLWDNWGVSQLLEVIDGLKQYLEERGSTEKEIADSYDTEAKIRDHKLRTFEKVLPEYWEEYVLNRIEEE
ncbi:MAG: endonuclease V [bacterium]